MQGWNTTFMIGMGRMLNFTIKSISEVFIGAIHLQNEWLVKVYCYVFYQQMVLYHITLLFLKYPTFLSTMHILNVTLKFTTSEYVIKRHVQWFI